MREYADNHEFNHERPPKIVCRLVSSEKSLQHREIEFWHSIPIEIKSCITPYSFKKKFKSHLLRLYTRMSMNFFKSADFRVVLAKDGPSTLQNADFGPLRGQNQHSAG